VGRPAQTRNVHPQGCRWQADGDASSDVWAVRPVRVALTLKCATMLRIETAESFHFGETENQDESPARSWVRPARPNGDSGCRDQNTRHRAGKSSHCGTFNRALRQVAAAPSHHDTWTDMLRRVRLKSPRHKSGGDRARKCAGRRSVARVSQIRKPPRSMRGCPRLCRGKRSDPGSGRQPYKVAP
jgi:hypothetical protein